MKPLFHLAGRWPVCFLSGHAKRNIKLILNTACHSQGLMCDESVRCRLTRAGVYHCGTTQPGQEGILTMAFIRRCLAHTGPDMFLWLVPKGLCLIWSRDKKMRQSPMGVGAIDSIRSHREERSGINAHWRTAPVAEQVGGVWAAAENASWLPEK